MKKYIIDHTLSIIVLITIFASGCKKSGDVILPPSQAHFTNLQTGSYSITAPGVTYKIPIGVTTVSDKDRMVTVSVSSPSGAVSGTHYTLSATTMVIPAGKAIDSLEVKGVYSQYTSGRRDVLIFTIQNNQVGISDYNDTFRLSMRGPCFEGDVDLNELLGTYNNTNELFGTAAYGPYPTSIIAVTQVPGATTGTVRITNIWDNGWNPITFTLDWTDPANRKVTLVQQTGIGDAGTINPAYTGQDILVRPFAGQVGTYSICNQTLTLKMQLGVTGLGVFPPLYTVTMAR